MFSGLPLSQHQKTQHALKLKGGTTRVYISLGFALQDAKNFEGAVSEVLAKDVRMGGWIDAEKAYYVVNSAHPGAIGKYGKFAFKHRKDAKAFVELYGGDIRGFEFAAYMAKRDHTADLKTLGTQKQKRHYPIGEKIFTSLCPPDLQANHFSSLAHAKTYLWENRPCGHLHETYLHALSLYLYEGQSIHQEHKLTMESIMIPEKAKCPVCGMFVAKYPRWAALVELEEGRSFYFDGVKDMMKFLLSPKKYKHFTQGKAPKKVLVTDYYTLEKIDAKSAFYVVGSQVYGPMGHELIPFAKKEDANNFLKDHNGKEILPFEACDAQVVFELDSH